LIVKTDGHFPLKDSSFIRKSRALKKYMAGSVLAVTSITAPGIGPTLPTIEPSPVAKNKRKQKSGNLGRRFEKKRIHPKRLNPMEVVSAVPSGTVQVMMEAKLGKVDTDKAPFSNQVGTVLEAPT
jgi:hypothetical protein